jgi:DNA modification methylase
MVNGHARKLTQASRLSQRNGHSNPFLYDSGQIANSRLKWEVHCGDALAALTTMPAESFDSVVTSPPYFWQRDYKVKGQIGMEPSVDEYVQSIADIMDQVRRVLRPTGSLLLNLGDTYYSGKGKPHGKDPKHNGRRWDVIRAVDASGLGLPKKTLIGIPWRVALEMVERGWVLRAPIIWRRENALPEANVHDRPWRTYEFVFLFAQSRHYNFSRRPLVAENVEDVWTIESHPKGGRRHPAVFPPELVRRCLAVGNPKRGLVLDPFVGSGTVMRVALEEGMSVVGIDLKRAFCRMISKELRELPTTLGRNPGNGRLR